MHVRAVETGVGVGSPPSLFADQFTPYQSGGGGQIMPTTLLLPPTALDVTREKKMHSAAAAAEVGRTSTRLAYLQPSRL